MRLAIAAGTLRGAGSGMVGREVISHMLRDNPSDEFLAWVPVEWRDLHGSPTTTPSAVHYTHTRHGQRHKFANEVFVIPRTCRKRGVEALFSMGDTGAPRPGIPHLLFVQQAFLVAPEGSLDFPMPVSFRLRLRAMAAYTSAGLAGVTRFTVQTIFMKEWLARRWAIDPSRIDVTPSAPSPEMQGLRCEPVQDPEPYVVYLSSAGPHKNHVVVPRMLRHLKDGGVRIRCILTVRAEDAPDAAMEARRLGVDDSVEFAGPVTRDRAGALLTGALAHVVPSKLESFGLGVLEALAVGCPVVAADRQHAREMCDDAALYAEADQPAVFAQHVAALADSGSFWRGRSDAALGRYRQVGMDWKTIASRYHALLKEIAS